MLTRPALIKIKSYTHVPVAPKKMDTGTFVGAAFRLFV